MSQRGLDHPGPFAVDLTTEGAVVCQRCAKALPPGSKLTFIHSSDSTRAGRNCCEICVDYYRIKATRSQNQGTHSYTPLQLTHAAAVHGHNNAAQRGAAISPVVALGQIKPYHSQAPKGRPNLMPPPPIPAKYTAGPSVITPRLANQSSHTLQLSLISQLKPPIRPGYQDAHRFYNEMRQYMQKMAYAHDNTEVFSIRVYLKVSEIGKVRQSLVGNVYETQGNIPAHIGVRSLKELCFYTALPLFLKWSHDYPLLIEDVKLRDKKWVEFLPRMPDIDAVADSLYVAAGGKAMTGKGLKKFRTAQIDLMLELGYERYQEVLEHIERKANPVAGVDRVGGNSDGEDDIDEHSHHDVDPDVPPPTSGRARVPRQSGSLQLSTTPHLLSQKLNGNLEDGPKDGITIDKDHQPAASGSPLAFTPNNLLAKRKYERPAQTTPPPSERQWEDSNYLRSPDAKKLKGALSGLRGPNSKVIRKLMNETQKVVEVDVYTPQAPLVELMENPDLSRRLLDPVSSAYSVSRTTLVFPSNPNKKIGSFRQAWLAESSDAILETSKQVFLKQMYYRSSKTQELKAYDSAKQVQGLVTDMCCLVWADGLMKLVYAFIQDKDKDRRGRLRVTVRDKGQSPPTVPVLRFTSCGLACSYDRSEIFMVEEYIDEPREGRFLKYINNSSAKPLFHSLPDQEHRNIAAFLSFAQHVQYIKTKGMVYISDLQGGLYTLSDPQIITSRELGDGIFGEGNLNHDRFKEEHNCNDFCLYYGLTRFPPKRPLFGTPEPMSDEDLPQAPISIRQSKGKARERTEDRDIADDGGVKSMDISQIPPTL